MDLQRRALLIGNSDGIGLATTKHMLASGWQVVGVSRSESPIRDEAYTHHACDVTSAEYVGLLERLLGETDFELCIYCAAIGELIDLNDLQVDVQTLEVNLVSMVRTVAVVIPVMVARESGHFIGVSSIADDLISPKAPAYFGSKAGFTSYIEGLRQVVKPKGVKVTNVRFGLVETKLIKGQRRPFTLSVDQAAEHMMTCIKKQPNSHTAPWIMFPAVKAMKWWRKMTTR